MVNDLLRESSGDITKNEIFSQAESWEKAIDSILINAKDFRSFIVNNDKSPLNIFLGCGSSYYLAITAARAFQQSTNQISVAVPASEIILNPSNYIPSGFSPNIIAISRSGETSEIVYACEYLRSIKSKIISITTDERSSVAKLSDFIFAIPGVEERSLVQTRSFTAMLIIAISLGFIGFKGGVFLDGIRILPELVSSFIPKISTQIESQITSDFSRFYYLGNGPRYGLASEGKLLMEEMALKNADSYHFLEFRHGPQCMANETTVVIGLVDQAHVCVEMEVLSELQKQGVMIISIDNQSKSEVFPNHLNINYPNQLSELLSLPFFMPPMELLAFYQSQFQGINPDDAEKQVRVVKLSDSIINQNGSQRFTTD